MIAKIKRNRGLTKFFAAISLMLSIMVVTGCAKTVAADIPSDFLFVMDVGSVEYPSDCVNLNIRIVATGQGRYEYYDTDCTIVFDSNHVVTYNRGQVVKSGRLKLNASELEQLWEALSQNNFFDLKEDYRMEMGFSYAFIMIEANGRTHIVDNIGMEVPEIRAIVEATDALMPEGVNLDYGEGYLP